MQRVLDLLCSQRAKKHYFHFRRDKKEVPARGANLAIKSEAIERVDDAPVAGVGLTLQALAWKAQKRRPLRHQDRADLNFLGHGDSSREPQFIMIVASSGLRRRCKSGPVGRDPLLLKSLFLVLNCCPCSLKSRLFSVEVLCRMA